MGKLANLEPAKNGGGRKHTDSEIEVIQFKLAKYIIASNPKRQEIQQWLSENYDLNGARTCVTYITNANIIIRETVMHDLVTLKSAQVDRLFGIYQVCMEKRQYTNAVSALKEIDHICGLDQLNVNLTGGVDNTLLVKFIKAREEEAEAEAEDSNE